MKVIKWQSKQQAASSKQQAKFCGFLLFVKTKTINSLSYSQSAFTLVELSIVLVIIGFLAGGVLFGQDLIEAANLRSVISQVDSYKAASKTFEIKYNCKAGDCTNATSLFTAPAPQTPYVSGAYNCLLGTDIPYSNGISGWGQGGAPAGWTGLCNGNGNGMIETAGAEDMQFWKHLALAGLISGNYTGFWDSTKGASWDNQTPGYNVPKAPIGNGGFNTLYLGYQDYYFPTGNYGNIIGLSGDAPFGSSYSGWLLGMGKPLLTTKQAYNIDSKIDDGLPYTGNIRAGSWMLTGAGCITTASANTSNYDLKNSVGATYGIIENQPQCILIWMNAF